MKDKILKPVFLKKGKESSLLRYHRWIFSGALHEKNDLPDDGEFVEVFDSSGKYLATGFYQAGNIAVRIVSFEKIRVNEGLWTGKIRDAYRARERMGLAGNPETTGYRLFFGEGDEIPGLIIDIYDRAAIIQGHAIAIYRNRHEIAAALEQVMGDRLDTVFYSSSISSMKADDEFLKGSDDGIWFRENNLKFYARWQKGQKTGFFLDQRENRRRLRDFVRDKMVLDAFCYTGGFAANALAAGARAVHAVDVSKPAIESAAFNFERNRFRDNYELIARDVREYLRDTREKYDVMVIDPPAYAKHVSARHKAVQGYKHLNRIAMEKISEHGILFTFSCSQAVDRKLFENTIRAAAIESGRKVSILGWLSQPSDHRVNIFHPETEYLKGLVIYVV